MLPIKIKLPDHFLEEEERDGYLVSSEMKKVWAILLDLFSEFQRVCDKYHIQWWADAGTILGAARHKGMIPWDDDIDVMLMRDEYEKLCKVAEKEFKYPYFFQTEETDKESARGHAQLRNSKTTGILKNELKPKRNFNQGIFLDIFPIDAIPDDEILFTEQTKRILSYKKWTSIFLSVRQYYNYNTLTSLKRKFAFPIMHLLTKIPLLKCYNYQVPYNKYLKEMIKYNGMQTKRVCKLVLCPIKQRRVWQRSWFNDTTYLPFEFMQIPVPVGYKQLLDTFYGDWHTFIVGTSTHGGCLFDAEKPYTEYIK